VSQSGLPTIAVLLTQVANAEALAATCALNKIKAWAVPSPIGAYAVAQDARPAQVEHLAKSVSALVKGVPAILVVSTDGQMTATQWQDGAATGTLPPALVLDGAPHELEDVLLGQTPATQIAGVVDAGSIGRFKAMRMLASAAKTYNAKAD